MEPPLDKCPVCGESVVGSSRRCAACGSLLPTRNLSSKEAAQDLLLLFAVLAILAILLGALVPWLQRLFTGP